MEQFSLDEYLKNPERKVITRDGRTVRIVCTDFNNEYFPIIGEIQDRPTPETFTKKGGYRNYRESDLDLFFAPEKKEGWANIYLCEGEYSLDDVIYSSRIDAEESGKKFEDYLTTIQIEWEE